MQRLVALESGLAWVANENTGMCVPDNSKQKEQTSFARIANCELKK